MDLDVEAEVLDTSVDVDEALSIGGSGGNTATNSIGTVQLGGGNTADDSIGTVQSGPISNDLLVEVDSELLDSSADVDVPLSIGGTGGNSATDSIGTLQIGGGQLGGGNTASDSIGTIQSGPIAADPSLDASSSLLDLDLQAEAPFSVGGNGGNLAEDSIGTVQIGGGNVADDSIGTVQIGGVSSGGGGGSDPAPQPRPPADPPSPSGGRGAVPTIQVTTIRATTIRDTTMTRQTTARTTGLRRREAEGLRKPPSRENPGRRTDDLR